MVCVGNRGYGMDYRWFFGVKESMVRGLMDKNYWRCGAVVVIAVGEYRYVV